MGPILTHYQNNNSRYFHCSLPKVSKQILAHLDDSHASLSFMFLIKHYKMPHSDKEKFASTIADALEKGIGRWMDMALD